METLNRPAPVNTPSPSPIPRPEPPAPPPRLGRWMLLAVVIVATGLAAGLIPRWRSRAALKSDTEELSIPTVNVVRAAPGKKLSGMLLPAEVRPYVEAPIYARASGYITNWHADIGATVKAGELLADIDTPEVDQELAAARAGLAQAQAALALARVTADRWAALLKTSSVSEQEEAEKAADLKLKQANVDSAQATMQQFEDLKAFAHVMAPFAGTITARDIDIGDLISPGKELFRLSDTATLRVFVRVPQSVTPGISVGAEADIIIPEMPGRKFPAKIVRTAGDIDATSRTLLVELDMDNAQRQIIAGSYAQVSFKDANPNPALILPSNALLYRAEGPRVGVVKPDGEVELRSVMLGRDFGASIEVLSGLTANDRVIINPSDSLVSGAHVRVAETSPDAMAVK
ncbi:MAG TPA: efflux RND transporter periplasmic adaptor subunit [Candidatus Saccharimonadales bacterium]|nr:efflux RND transporter periplasmic adaptor subunit [Candidatus Saccharimonadales bacterium]